MDVIKVKPWGKGQGDFVEINKEDFDEDKHTVYGESKQDSEAEKADEAAKLAASKVAEALKAKAEKAEAAKTKTNKTKPTKNPKPKRKAVKTEE